MYYGEIKKCDIANGPGVRVSLFVSGCTHHCKGCFNEETWSFEYGKPFTEETEEQILKLLEPSYISGLTVLGGEPMEYMNQEVLFPFLKKVKERFPEKSIWCFTGYVYEKDILHRMIPKWKYTKKMLEQIDYLVDGPFVMEKKNISLKFRGSSNQRIIDGNPDLQFLEQCYIENIDEIIDCRQKASKCSKVLRELYNSKATLVSAINVAIYGEFESMGAVPSYEIMQEIQKAESGRDLESYPPGTFDEDRNHYAGVIKKKPSGTSLA